MVCGDATYSAPSLQSYTTYLDTDTCTLGHDLLDADTACDRCQEQAEGIEVALCGLYRQGILWHCLHKDDQLLDKEVGTQVREYDPEQLVERKQEVWPSKRRQQCSTDRCSVPQEQ